jgi:hypothetical protein
LSQKQPITLLLATLCPVSLVHIFFNKLTGKNPNLAFYPDNMRLSQHAIINFFKSSFIRFFGTFEHSYVEHGWFACDLHYMDFIELSISRKIESHVIPTVHTPHYNFMSLQVTSS